MADQTITNRVVSSRGSMKMETGDFTDSGSDITIRTKLGVVRAFRLSCQDNDDYDATVSINSLTNSATQDDGGYVQIPTATLDGTEYSYMAIGQ